jgi:hypothetical protein
MTRWVSLTVLLTEDVLSRVQTRAREDGTYLPVDLGEWCANAIAQELRRRQIAQDALQEYRASGRIDRARRTLTGQTEPVAHVKRRCKLCHTGKVKQRGLCWPCYMRVYRLAAEFFGHRKEA